MSTTLPALLCEPLPAAFNARPVGVPGVGGHRCPHDWPDGNSVWSVAGEGPREALVHAVDLAHAGVRSRFTLQLRDAEGLAPTLTEHGYQPMGELQELHLDLRSATLSENPNPGASRVLRAEHLVDWFAVRIAAGVDRSPPTRALFAVLVGALAAADGGLYLVRDRSGSPRAAGGITLYRAAGLAYLWGGASATDARGRGDYRACVAARWQEARQAGMDQVVAVANSSSAPILREMGMIPHARWTQWIRPAGDSDTLPHL